MASTTPSRLWTSLRSLPGKQHKLPSYCNTFIHMKTKENAQNDSKGFSADLGKQEDEDLHCWWNWLVWFSIWEPGLLKWKHEGGRTAGQYRGLPLGTGPVEWLLGGDRWAQVSSILWMGIRACERWTSRGQASPWSPVIEQHWAN